MAIPIWSVNHDTPTTTTHDNGETFPQDFLEILKRSEFQENLVEILDSSIVYE